MSHLIVSVDPRSPAQRAGIRAGDRLARIGGVTVIDFIDYQALSAQRRLTVQVLRDGAALDFAIRKDEYAPLGLNFETPMMSGTRLCCNKCLFCFVDQLPGDARETMRVKDDDWRMSLMMGNYVTLTNVSDRELERIIARHCSPLYISVHCTDPDLRTHVLGTPRARRLMGQLQRLSDGGIEFHCQCVLCPGINDGAALERTIRELSGIPGARSLALVPVGLTGHREGLSELRPYTREEARAVVELAEKWRDGAAGSARHALRVPLGRVLPPGRTGPSPRTRPTRATSRSTTAWACCGCWTPSTARPGRSCRRSGAPIRRPDGAAAPGHRLRQSPPRRSSGTCCATIRWPGRPSRSIRWKTPGSAPPSPCPA